MIQIVVKRVECDIAGLLDAVSSDSLFICRHNSIHKRQTRHFSNVGQRLPEETSTQRLYSLLRNMHTCCTVIVVHILSDKFNISFLR